MRFIGFYQELDAKNSDVYRESIPLTTSQPSSYPAREVSQYLLSGYPVLDVTEMTSDVVSDAFRVPGGSSVLTDGAFAWRLDLASYVEHYSIALPQDFLAFAEDHGYRVPRVEQERLIEISLMIGRTLGFRTDMGAGPRVSGN